MITATEIAERHKSREPTKTYSTNFLSSSCLNPANPVAVIIKPTAVY